MKNMNDYIDKYDIVVKGDDKDGGDGCHKTMHYIFTKHKRDEYANKVMDMLECPKSPGNYRRHPDLSKWYSQCNRMSRDQSTPLLVVMGIFNLRGRLVRFFKAHLKRGLLFTTNTRKNGELAPPWKLPDFTGPSFWALYIRGLQLRPLYFLLYILDLELVVDAVVRKISKQDDVSNYVILALYSERRMSTLVSKLAVLITDWDDIKDKLDSYWGRDDEPPINLYYRELIDD